MLIQSNCSHKPLSGQDLESSLSSFNVHDLPSSSIRKDCEVDSEMTSAMKVSSTKKIEFTEKTQKSVSFNRVVKYREIPHYKEIPQQQREELWETVDGLVRIRKDALLVVEIMNCGLELVNDIGQRGLRCLCQAQKTKRKVVRSQAYLAVILMQQLQVDLWTLYNGESDISEAIGQNYARICEQSKNDALRRGMEDFNDAAAAYL